MRATWLLTILLVGALIANMGILVTAATTEYVVSWRGRYCNTCLTNSIEGRGIILPPKRIWAIASTKFTIRDIITSGNLVWAARYPVPFEEKYAQLVCIDLRTKRVLKTYFGNEYDAYVVPCWATSDTLLFFTVRKPAGYHHFMCWRVGADGSLKKQRWTRTFPPWACPMATLAGTLIYVRNWAEDRISCLHIKNGACAWNYTVKHPLLVVAVKENRVFACSADGTLYCIHALTSKRIWRFSLGSSCFTAATVVGERVLVGTESGLVYCINASTGRQLWKRSLEVPVYHHIVANAFYAFVVTADGGLHCLSLSTGDVIWSLPLDVVRGKELKELKGYRMEYSSIAASNCTVYACLENKTVVCLNAFTGRLLWRVKVPYRPERVLILGSYMLVEAEGRLYCYKGEVFENIPPQLKVITPKNNSIVRGTLHVKISATDNVDILRVRIYLDGKLLRTLRSRPFDITINTREYKDGPHTLLVVAEDLCGNVARARIDLLFDNTPPTIKHIDYPPAPEEDKPITISVRARDEISGIARVELHYRINEGPWRVINMTKKGELWEATIPAQSAGTRIEFFVRVYDRAGNVVRSDTLTITVTRKFEFWKTYTTITIIFAVAAILIIGVIIYFIRRHHRS